jgi:lipopolysaccharide transport system permease protein
MFSHYKDIVLYSTYANLKAENERTYLGYLWWLLEPLLNTVLFYVIFFMFLKHGEPGFLTFLLIGTIMWQWFQGTVMISISSIVEKAGVIKQVYLPKIIFPIVKVLANTWKFMWVFMLLLIYLWIMGKYPNVYYFYLIPIMILNLALILQVSYILAIIVPFFPDLQTVTDTFLRMMMLFSGIFFAGTQVPADYQLLFYSNPIAVLLESYRDILLYAKAPNFLHLGYVLVVSLILVPVMISINKRLDLSVAKAVN